MSRGTIHVGDSLEVLKTLPDASVQTCVTSPPYWGLRDYGTNGQLGLEETPEEYVQKLVAVFREVRRVLADDGTVWLNLGDSYNGAGYSNHYNTGGARDGNGSPGHATTGIKPKDLVGIPWRVAFALQADGWWLRQDIIWSKPNPMPESVRDRCTKAHEYIFLLSKSARYYYDADAIAEPVTTGFNGSEFHTGKTAEHQLGRSSKKKRSGNKERKPGASRGIPGAPQDGTTNGAVAGSVPWEGDTRNKRSVWTVATQPFPEAHFATFPPKLIEPCILAGSREGDTVLDPFSGAGTTGVVALSRGRDYIGIELNPDYAEMSRKRIYNHNPLFNEISVAA